MLKLCHAGLNYGGGQSPEGSGEIGALEFVRGNVGASGALTLFDVGANDGDYLRCALKVLGNDVTAYSFEPQSVSYDRLDVRFAGDRRVRLSKIALGKEEGTAELFFGQSGESTASLHRSSVLEQTASESVSVTTVDRFCADNSIDRIDLLKIDSEGHEVEVLLGASDMIAGGRVRFVQLEFGDTFLGTPYHFLDIWNLLSPRYVAFRILRHGLIKVPKYVPDLEIYKVANFLFMEVSGRAEIPEDRLRV